MKTQSSATWRKFLISALAVGLVSVLWNVFIIHSNNSHSIWINFLEKIFIFVLIGLFGSFYKPEILQLNKLKSVILVSFLVAIIITLFELISVNATINYAINVGIVRFFGALLGILIVNAGYKLFK